jgi:enterochelin esterase-like enzyme
MKLVHFLLFITLSCVPMLAQELVPGSSGTDVIGSVKVKSPDIGSDGSVTFRLFAPKASLVLLQGSWSRGKDVAMSKNASGIWSVTTAPLPAEGWVYIYQVDGVAAIDPSNYNVVRDGLRYINSFVVPGDASLALIPKKVPHGTMSEVWVHSSVVDTDRRMIVYTPPGYEDSKLRYPVLYLLQGSGSDEEAWPVEGAVNKIMDNLIATGKAKPMIVVMPNAYARDLGALDVAGLRTVPPPGTTGPPLAGATPAPATDYRDNEQDIVGDLVPYVDRHYRTLANPDNRALAGLSMGAGITSGVGLKRMDTFAWDGLFSTGNFRTPPYGIARLERDAPLFLKNVEESNRKIRLLFVSVGTDDPRYPSTTQVVDALRARNIHIVYKTYAGAHEWKVWRASLIDFTSLLFKGTA